MKNKNLTYPTKFRINDFKGAIFDVDDTLLTNFPDSPLGGLHERSRLRAIKEIGRKYNLTNLENITPRQNIEAFEQAKEHTMDSAVWRLLFVSGLVKSENIDHGNKLLNAIVKLKNKVHEDTLRHEGREVPGAKHFVESLANAGLNDNLAIASNAIRRDINIFLEISSLKTYFPDEKIVSNEQVKNPKPHPEIYNLAFDTLKMSNVARPKIMAFEDDPRGIISAKSAGLFTCAITTRYQRSKFESMDNPPDLIAESFVEFEKILF